jgi:hypothetical protein
MVTVDGLYSFCTVLGTFIFGLIFLNYYLEADHEPEPEHVPGMKPGKRPKSVGPKD